METTAAVYARVSREEQTKGHSLDTQVADARAWAASRGLGVSRVYREEGVSGAERSRPALDRLVADASAGEFGVVLVRHVDRLTRDAGFALELSQRLASLGVSVVAFGESDQTSEGDRFMYGIRALVAEQERSRTRERMMRGKRAAAAEGKWHGGEPPYGTRAAPAPDGRGSVLELDEGEASALRDVRRWIVEERASVYEAAARLNAAGVPTKRGRRWTAQNLGLLLKSPRLAGRSVWWGEEVDVPAVFTPAQYAGLREAMDVSARRSRARSGPRQYPLSGRIVCGCGAHWVGGFRRGERWYHCSRHPSYAGNNEPCAWTERRWIRADRIEAAVRELLRREYLGDRWTLRLLALDHLARIAGDGDGGRLAAARARVSDLESRYRRIVVDLAGADVDPDVLRGATAEVGGDLAEARRMLADEERDAPLPSGAEWTELLARLREAWEGAGTMADLADAVGGETGERMEALALLPEVDALAERAARWLEEGDLEAVADALGLRVRLTGFDSFEVDGLADVVSPAPFTRDTGPQERG